MNVFNNNPFEKEKRIHHFLISSKEERRREVEFFKCPHLEIKKAFEVPLYNLACKPHIPSQSGCKFAANEYVYNTTTNTCKKQRSIENICNKTVGGVYTCSFDVCGKHFHGNVLIHVFDERTGNVKVTDYEGTSVKQLENKVQIAVDETVRKGHNYLFLSCGGNKNQTQLLSFLPTEHLSSRQPPSVTREKQKKININLFNYDSVSRAHFYRSLQKSIKAMNQINSNQHKYHAEILDFELFQSIHGHSQENSYAMMTGNVFPKTISPKDRELTPTRIQEFYKFLKEMNYDTFYQDDMCMYSGYGLKRDFGALEKDFVEYKAMLDDESYIDDYGLTFATCKMIQDVFNENEIFNLNSAQKVCYNGQPNDAYLLDYNLHKFEEAEKQGKNLFSYNNLQFSHDSIGMNIQTMDESIADFLYSSSKLTNTLTILLADHGNSCTSYAAFETEGLYEQYHPSLFMIVPEGVRKRLGEQNLHALRLNQKRLVTMIDIHKGIRHIVDSNHQQKGFLEIVPENRTCQTVALGKPNLCVCEGSESPVENKTEFIGQLEFAIDKLNNMIRDSSRADRCKKIVPLGMVNVLQRNHGVILIFDVLAAPGVGSSNTEERFSFEVFYKESKSSEESFDGSIRMSTRLSKYGLHNKACSDAPVTFRHCVCDMVATNKTTMQDFPDLLKGRSSMFYRLTKFSDYTVVVKEYYIESDTRDVALHIREYRSVDDEDSKESLKQRRRVDLHTVTFEILYLGLAAQRYDAEIRFTSLVNMKPMNSEVCKGTIKPRSILYLCTIQRVEELPSQYKYAFELKGA